MTTLQQPTPAHAALLLAAAKRASVGVKKCVHCKTPTRGVNLKGRANCADCASCGVGQFVTKEWVAKYQEGRLL
jgi:hypothetical protein